MDRKRSFQTKSRFDRAKTPMGAVPISVICGFDYPLAAMEEAGCGRGEVAGRDRREPSSYRYLSGGRAAPTQLDTGYMDSNRLERLQRPGPAWPSGLTSPARASTLQGYRSRAGSEVRRGPAAPAEHPKQEPCRYAAALATRCKHFYRCIFSNVFEVLVQAIIRQIGPQLSRLY